MPERRLTTLNMLPWLKSTIRPALGVSWLSKRTLCHRPISQQLHYKIERITGERQTKIGSFMTEETSGERSPGLKLDIQHLIRTFWLERIDWETKIDSQQKLKNKPKVLEIENKQTTYQPTWVCTHCLTADLSRSLAPIVLTPISMRRWSDRDEICRTSISWSEKVGFRCSNPFPLRNLDVSLAAAL